MFWVKDQLSLMTFVIQTRALLSVAQMSLIFRRSAQSVERTIFAKARAHARTVTHPSAHRFQTRAHLFGARALLSADTEK